MTLYLLTAEDVAVALRLRSRRWRAAHVVLGLLWPFLLAGVVLAWVES